MLKRLFGQKKPAPPPLPPTWAGPAWGAPQAHYQTYFNLHLYNLPLDVATTALTAKYLPAAPLDPAILVQPQGAWITAYFAPELVAKVGFNKLAAEIAREHNTWLIGYRIYAEQGMDVHYFDRTEHVAGLALGQDELEREPLAPEIFADLADVRHIVPRAATQHPLDFHFALLHALGIQAADLTWVEALRLYENGALDGAQLLPAG